MTAGDAAISLSEIELLTDGRDPRRTPSRSARPGLTATSGVASDFALGILSGGVAEGYAATVDWGDGTDVDAATIGDPSWATTRCRRRTRTPSPGSTRARSRRPTARATRIRFLTVDYLEPGLRAAFDSVCIADDGVGANCDAKGISFPREGLADGGLDAGVEHDVPGTDLTFTTPGRAGRGSRQRDGRGQTIAVDLGEGATKLSFIGAATERNQDTTATVNFTEGDPVTTPLQFSDWTKGGNATPRRRTATSRS